MAGAERLFPSFGSRQSVRQVFERLERIVYLHIAARLFSDCLLKSVLEFGLDDKDHAREACTVCVVDGIVENDLPAGSERVDLLEAAITRAHTRSHDNKRR